MKKLLLFIILLSSYSFAQNEIIRRIEFEDSLEAVRASIAASGIDSSIVIDLILANTDTILSGTATVLFLSDPIVDSIVVTHNVGTTPSINDIQITPQTDLKGYQYWIENITSTTFEIQMNSDIGFEAMATNPKFTWWVIKRQ